MVRYYKRENKKTGICYQARIRIKGYDDLVRTFKLKSDAQAWAEPIELAMKNGTYKQGLENIPNNSNINIPIMKNIRQFMNGGNLKSVTLK